MYNITTSRLAAADTDEAFVLARLSFDHLGPARWRRICRSWTARPAGPKGALIARDPAGRQVGLAPFAVRDNIPCHRILWVERVVVFALLDPAPIYDAIADGLAGIAAEQKCVGFEIAVRAGDLTLRSALAGRKGHREATVVHCPI